MPGQCLTLWVRGAFFSVLLNPMVRYGACRVTTLAMPSSTARAIVAYVLRHRRYSDYLCRTE